MESVGLDVSMCPLEKRNGAFMTMPTQLSVCLPMASNYNLVPRPAVLLVDEQEVRMMERRETYDVILVRYMNV